MRKQKNGFRQKFFQNTSVWFAIAFISISIFSAIFCYFIAPDTSSNAHRIIPAIANLRLGEKVDFVIIKNKEKSTRSTWDKFLYGDEIVEEWIPYDSLIQSENKISYKVFSHGDKTLNEWKNIKIPPHDKERFGLDQKKFVLGTDKQGRDILSRLMVGTRVSFAVGFVAVLISMTIGVLLGSFAGYFGGWMDRWAMWLINVFWAIPTILLVFAIVMGIGKGFWQIFIAIGITMWVGPARIIRGQVLGLKEENYIKAAKTLGFSGFRIITKHILPNIVGTVMVLAAANFATAILIEAGLSFLGLGIQPPMASWGLMVKEQYNYLITDNPLPTLIPGIAIMLSVLSFNIIGNALRDAFDVNRNHHNSFLRSYI